ncbi:hypothetical protein CDL12_17704 [Handroanthus impetiginosus]|uniref:F-box domain-containing protein n=1 Tax=Handroanthus impetiginosus TaxID=429701 RepID=A0A2G9GXH8_9LAMI|nr:hypothetical protein CDL12_17704 [Handroanthus impetiginosus]
MAVEITTAASTDVEDLIDDLLMQILLRLPVKSLMRCKLVSKRWKSLINSPQFCFLHHPDPHPVGLVYCFRWSSGYEYINLDVKNPINPPFTKLMFPGEPFPFLIQHSCNGLLLCCCSGNYEERLNSCYVYNPTTKCFNKLPTPGIVCEVPKIVFGVNLAFDHAKFPHYKVVCVRESEVSPALLQIEIYSAESGAWRVSGEPFGDWDWFTFEHGVYWNGSVHWISHRSHELLYFNVDKECFGKMILPAMVVCYFGESCDHMHIIESSITKIAFNVYEIKRDYSECFVKYHVDLTTVAAAFPDMTYMNPFINRTCYKSYVFSLIRREEEGSFLVLQVSRKAIQFNLHCNTFEEICDLEDYLKDDYKFEYLSTHVHPGSRLPRAFEHIESLAGV